MQPNKPTNPVLVSQTALDWALRHARSFGDTVFFPRAFEFDAIHHCWTEVRSWLCQQDMRTWRPQPYRRFLAPKNRHGFRYVTQLDPLEHLVFSAMVYEIGSLLESTRVPASDQIVYSWRFESKSGGQMYDPDYRWSAFSERCMHLSSQPGIHWVAIADIADFFPRLYFHRLEDELARLPQKQDIAHCVIQLIKSWNTMVSYGLPVGLSASRILAESTLNEIDQYLIGQRSLYCRYSDDFRIFTATEGDARCALEGLAMALFERQGLTLQPSKTRILPVSEFARKFGLSEDRVQAESLSDTFRQILEDAGIEDDYEEEFDYDDLDPDIQERIDELDLDEVFREQMEEDEPDPLIIGFILHRYGQLNLATIVDDVLSNLERLHHVTEGVVKYLRMLRGGNASIRRRIGQKVIETLDAETGNHSVYRKACLLSLFTHDREYNCEGEFERLYQRESEPTLRRKIILALGRAKKDYWFGVKRRDYSSLDPWQRRAFIAAASCLPADQRTYFYRSLREGEGILEKVIIKWASDKPFA